MTHSLMKWPISGQDIASFIVAFVFLSIAILIELVLVFLIIDMKRWNDFTKIVLSISILDIASFTSDLISWIFQYQFYTGSQVHNVKTQNIDYLFYSLPFGIIIPVSVVFSLVLTYKVYHILRYKTIFDVSEASSLGKLVFYVAVLIPIMLFICSYVFYVKCEFDDDDTPYDCTTKHNLTTLRHFNFAILFYPNLLIFISFCIYMVNVSYTRGLRNPSAFFSDQSVAISILVTRLKYYPVIQAGLFYITLFVNISTVNSTDSTNNTGYAFFYIFYLFPPSAYLCLFLNMQPNAYKHLKSRLRCIFFSSRTVIEDQRNSIPTTTIRQISKASAQSQSQSFSFSLSDRLTQNLVDDNNFEAIYRLDYLESMEDHELCKMIALPNNSISSSNSGSDVSGFKTIRYGNKVMGIGSTGEQL